MMRLSDSVRLNVDPFIQTRLESTAVREGLLDRDDYAFGQLSDIPAVYRGGVADDHVLSYLALYPTISATESEFALGKIAATTGLDISVKFTSETRWLLSKKEAAGWLDDHLLLMASANAKAAQACLANRHRIVELVCGQVPTALVEDPFFSDVADRSCVSLFGRLYRQILEELYAFHFEEISSSILQLDDITYRLSPQLAHTKVMNSPHFDMLVSHLEDFYTRLVTEYYLSQKFSNPLATSNGFRKPPTETVAAGDLAALTETIRVCFKDELTVLPSPRTIEEAVEMSEKKEVRRLRAVIERWLRHARADRPHLEARMRADVAKASRELRTLKFIREYKESPLVFAIKTGAGFVPIVSNVSSLLEAGSWIYERWLEDRTCWMTFSDRHSTDRHR